ncbi:MAG: BREX system P-loop protein BrxC [Candidatus Reddybacter sp.]
MRIEKLFSKPLTRNINGVVKADQLDDESVWIELDEYVVTNELDRHFRSFFETYTPAVLNPDDPAVAGKIGVWVSGFFGSGKSHFIKILSYLLENREAQHNGKKKRAIEFFKDKISDSMLFGDIHAAVNRDTDVILFNIDSRANTDDKEDAILKVFLKVFNEHVGYCGVYPHLANLERELDEQEKYQTFQDHFAEITGKQWIDERQKYRFKRDQLIQAFALTTGQTEESARDTFSSLEQNFQLDITAFCQWVKSYLDRSGDKHLIFLVDEVGQFIGQNTQMMLKLQTITENLGTICGGRAWVVVTSQADIDAVLGDLSSTQSNDFSKIAGRFHTRISLSSSNTNEVIQKRLLTKEEAAREELGALYSQKGDILKNQLAFDSTTTAELANYSDNIAFVDNYPFIPYQYLLVQKVFESIRRAGATGKHLSRGERSLLDAFQNAAIQIKDQAVGTLVPFHCFYPAIESFLDTTVKKTIDQAAQKESLTEFDNEILKTLFLIRYVDVVKSTLDNLVTLSIDEIDADKITLRKQIEESLNRLERQLLISRNGDEYIFLTNEEKELENEIRHTEIESSEMTNELSKLIFDEVLQRKNAYRYPVNKQDFKVSRFCNSHAKDGSTLEDLVVHVISPLDPNYSDYNEQYCLNRSSENDGSIIIKLGETKRLWDELSNYIKTDRFLKLTSGQRPEQEILLREKAMENQERSKRLRQEFEQLFRDAPLYAIGANLDGGTAAPVNRLESAYRYVIENTFSKLNLLKPTPGDVLRELQSVLVADDVAQAGLDLNSEGCNPQATQLVDQYISLNIELNKPVYVRDVVFHFNHRPHGWPNNEILLLVSRLVLAGKISFNYQKAELPLRNAYDHLTSTRKWGEIRINKIRQHDERQIKKAAELSKRLFNQGFSGFSEKELSEQISAALQKWQDALKTFQSKSEMGHYPGKAQIEKGLVLTSDILSQSSSFNRVQNLLDNANSLEDFSENFEDLDDFYTTQFSTWQQLDTALNSQFKLNRIALDKDPGAEKALKELEQIYNALEPYGMLQKISGLITKVQEVNDQMIDDKRNHALSRVEIRVKRVTDNLQDSEAPSEICNQALHPLQSCKKRIEQSQSMHEINSELMEAEGFEEDAEILINAYIQSQEAKVEVVSAESTDMPTKPPTTEKKRPPTRPTVTVSPADTFAAQYRGTLLESPQNVDDYLDTLRKQLINLIDDGKRIRIK